mmetsp:Transcript_28167/g.43398  ORF Transcript_28167/g.43398 Transcript_28167/m.43398 type:complete len:259 (-) Transcript_28167:14-790(-)|eukprot:CAMPEP_0117048878 /NCGR_PEP_ID=MMETSP0472-20121206/33792_1 /TAXON_ID=693140 ORGANISM="Tiarina fusus, Strain LIS" /NCGR_SAMPLE_ID=MMETSP0472 /ASSEMBLY_ACC=CAM_ASM_000603 /LENGTH=258 /DNA_ID=CAMNT_0004762155 /DNA_START=69 /DNA_END=845 /DNA_ORIENTATION=+
MAPRTNAVSIIVDDDCVHDISCEFDKQEPSNSTLSTVDESDSSDDDYLNIGSVRFSSTARTHLIDSHSTYSDKEVKRCWYSPEEKDKMAAKREKVILRMEEKKPERPGRPYRGLEHWTEEGSDQVTAQIDRVVSAVMDEQDEQWAKNVDDYDRIAAISRRESGVSVEQAIQNAYRDEQEATKIRSEDGMDDDAGTTCTDMTPKGPRKNRTTRSTRKKRVGRRKAGQGDPSGAKSHSKGDLVKKQRQKSSSAKAKKSRS